MQLRQWTQKDKAILIVGLILFLIVGTLIGFLIYKYKIAASPARLALKQKQEQYKHLVQSKFRQMLSNPAKEQAAQKSITNIIKPDINQQNLKHTATDNNSFLILLKSGANPNQLSNLNHKFSAKFKLINSNLNLYYVKLSKPRAAEAIIAYQESGFVKKAEANKIYRLFNLPASLTELLALDLKLDEGSGASAQDSSTKGLKATIQGASWVDGKYNKALSFDGTDDYLQVSDPNRQLNLKKNFSWGLWFNARNTNSATGRLLDAQPYYDGYSITMAYDKVRCGADNFYATSKTAVENDGKWHYIMCVLEPISDTQASLKMYLDNINEASYNVPVPIQGYSQSFIIGGGSSAFFNGNIDEVKIFNKALTADEVKLASEPSGKPEPYPNDPYYASKGAWEQDYDDLWGVKKVKSDKAWEQKNFGQNVVVAVIDTGVDYTHPDLKDNTWINTDEIPNNNIDDDNNGYIDDWRGYNFNEFGTTYCPPEGDSEPVKFQKKFLQGEGDEEQPEEPTEEISCWDDDGGPNNNPMDHVGHGTHVAGIIGAVGNNNQGIIGVAPKAKIMAVKAGGEYLSLAGLIQAINYAKNNGAKVMNFSWGGEGESPMLNAVINQAIDSGITIVAAAGNSAMNVILFNPANLKNVITVGASTPEDKPAFFTNQGPKIDVMAPGAGLGSKDVYGILSTFTTQLDNYYKQNYEGLIINDKYLRLAGTSMAAPFVSGAAALLISQNPNLSPLQIKLLLTASADDINLTSQDSGWDDATGFGRINIEKALNLTPKIISSTRVEISEPKHKSIDLGGTIKIFGTTAVNQFQKYEVYVKKIEYATSWKGNYYQTGFLGEGWLKISESNQPVTKNLLASWDTKGFSRGYYLIQLKVFTQENNLFSDLNYLSITNTKIAEPKNFSNITQDQQGKKIPISGRANIKNFQKFTLEYRENRQDAEWKKITSENSGLKPQLSNGILGYLNTKSLKANTQYLLKLTVTSQDNHQESDEIIFYSYPTITFVRHPGETINGIWLKDLNKDGSKEIIIAAYNEESGDTIYVTDLSGNSLSGWPVTLGYDYTFREDRRDWQYKFFFYDINNDHKLEILAYLLDYTSLETSYAYNSLKAWDYQGKPVEISGQSTFPNLLSPPLEYDIDRDDKLELIILQMTNEDAYNNEVSIWIMNNDGQWLGAWSPKKITRPPLPTFGWEDWYLAAGDYQNDRSGIMIISSSSDYVDTGESLVKESKAHLYLISNEAQILWQKEFQDKYLYAPIFLTNSQNEKLIGFLELIEDLSNTHTPFYILEAEKGDTKVKKSIPGWAYDLYQTKIEDKNFLLSSTANIATYTDLIYAFDTDTWDVVKNFPYSGGQFTIFAGLHFTDLDKDNQLEIVSSEIDGDFIRGNGLIHLIEIFPKTTYFLWRKETTYEGRIIAGWPKSFQYLRSYYWGWGPVPLSTGTIISDLTSDDYPEIIATSNYYSDDTWSNYGFLVSMKNPALSDGASQPIIDTQKSVVEVYKRTNLKYQLDVLVKIVDSDSDPVEDIKIFIEIPGVSDLKIENILNPTNEQGYGLVSFNYSSSQFTLNIKANNKLLTTKQITWP